MKSYAIRSRNGTASIERTDPPRLEPGASEVRVKLGAASLNHRDLLMLERGADGSLDGRIPLSDAAGFIDAVGPGVTCWKIGDRVASTFFPDWSEGPFRRPYLDGALGGRGADGVLSEYVTVPERGLVRAPTHLSAVEAATLPCAAVTAWHGLVARGGMTAESVVLIQGTGGVALFGLQFAAAMGARAIVISSSDEKLAKARELGAVDTINYRQEPDWDRQVLDRTGGEGATHILELGGTATFERSLRCLAAAGYIVQVGGLGGFDLRPDLDHLKQLSATITSINVGSAAHFETMSAFMSKQAIHPVVDRVFAFEQAVEAYAHLKGKRHFGKVVITGAGAGS